MMIFILVVVVLAIAGLLLFRSSAAPAKKKSSQKSQIDIPSKVSNPQLYSALPGVIAWEFVAPNLSIACDFAHTHAGTRKQAQACTPMPLQDCNSTACMCFYRPVFEQRKKQRRVEHDRRNSLRFEAGDDRRNGTDRRKDNLDWNENLLK